ncbi:MAG: PilZ domain-containing protein [Magnetococcales bacterium]|nr:PilZ domain-containing protein [Magnetococcales bacterium]
MLKIICAQQEIEFEKNLKLGISGIDEQHERLFILCHAVIQSNHANALQIEAILLEIESYISEHLAYEEEILHRSSPLILLQHKRLHDQFRKQYVQLNRRLLSVRDDVVALQSLAVEIATLLQEWLCQHIMKVDRQHRSHFLGTHGVKSRAPRMKVHVRALLEISGGRGLTGTVVDVSDSGALLFFQAVPSWIQAGETALLHIIPLEQSDRMPCKIVAVSKDDIRIAFLEREQCDLYSALVAYRK